MADLGGVPRVPWNPPFQTTQLNIQLTYKYLFSSMKSHGIINLRSCVVNNQLVGVVSIEIRQSMPYPRDQVVVA